MTISILEGILRTEVSGLEFNKAYYLFLRSTTTGMIEVSVYGTEIKFQYSNIHAFLKDWQSVSSHGLADNEKDLTEMFAEILRPQ